MSSDENRKATKSVRLTERAKERVDEQSREGETLSATVERAFDALERERAMPDAVRDALLDAESDTDGED
jgi:hypothetical protein